jgi:hypothetical protein
VERDPLVAVHDGVVPDDPARVDGRLRGDAREEVEVAPARERCGEGRLRLDDDAGNADEGRGVDAVLGDEEEVGEVDSLQSQQANAPPRRL